MTGTQAAHDDVYQKMRKKVRGWAETKEGRTSEVAEWVLLAPDVFHLLVRLSFDPAVPAREKVKIGVALAYFVSPIDFIPEGLVGPIGYLDDVGLALFVLNSVLHKVDHDVVLKHWAGERDLLKTTEEFLAKADDLLGSGLWGRLQKLAGLTRDKVLQATDEMRTALEKQTKPKRAAKGKPKATKAARTRKAAAGRPRKKAASTRRKPSAAKPAAKKPAVPSVDGVETAESEAVPRVR